MRHGMTPLHRIARSISSIFEGNVKSTRKAAPLEFPYRALRQILMKEAVGAQATRVLSKI